MKSISTGRAISVLLIAALALLVPLAGSANAAKKAKKNSVVTKSIKKGAVKASKIATGAVTTDKIADGAVTALKLAPLEATHLVGGSNEPGFENGWTAAGGSFLKAGFYKDALGIVHLEGGLDNPAQSGTVAFTLPAGYRPAATIGTGAGTATALDAGLRVTIAPEGTVTPSCEPFPYNDACSAFLDSISFRAAG